MSAMGGKRTLRKAAYFGTSLMMIEKKSHTFRYTTICGWSLILLGPMIVFGPYLYFWSKSSVLTWENPYEPYFYAAFFLALCVGLSGVVLIPKSNGSLHFIGCGYLLAMFVFLVLWSFAWCPGNCLP